MNTNQSGQKGNDIKKNPSRDYEKGQPGNKTFGSNNSGNNEVNPGKVGNQSEVDLNRNGITRVQKNATGQSSTQTQQQQPQAKRQASNQNAEDDDSDADSDVTGSQQNQRGSNQSTGPANLQ